MRAGRSEALFQRQPQPRCGRPSAKLPQQLSAPLFAAAEWPRRLLARKAPYGMRMAGKTEAEMNRVARAYLQNTSQPLQCQWRRCAVVGSAGKLRGSGFGRAIDAHDAVLRLNAAPTKGFEADVGSRTTWRVHNSEKPWFMAALDAPELQLVICHTAWIGACQHKAFSGVYSQHVALLNPVLYSQLWGLLGRPRGKQAPSTGLLAIAIALGVCDEVTIFGFSARGDKAECAHHYWDCPKWTRRYDYLDRQHKFHAWDEEVRLRESWIRRGVVVDGRSLPCATMYACAGRGAVR